MPGRKQATAPAKPTRTYKPCAHCGEGHHHFAKCRDGVRVNPGAPTFGSPERAAAAPEPDAVAQAAPVSAATLAREEMRDAINALPEGSKQRIALQLMLDRDLARDAHAAAEEVLKKATGDPTVRAPLPTILRDTSEEKGRALNRELDLVFHKEGRRPTADNLRTEAQTIHDTLGGLPQKREDEENAARDAAKAPERVPGETLWQCQMEACGTKFRTLSIEQARRKAAQTPGWMVACPACGSKKVLAMMLERVA